MGSDPDPQPGGGGVTWAGSRARPECRVRGLLPEGRGEDRVRPREATGPRGRCVQDGG